MTPLTLLGLWEVAAVILGPRRLPAPGETFVATAQSISGNSVVAAQEGGTGALLRHIGASVLHAGGGVLLGSAAAVGVVGLILLVPQGSGLIRSLIDPVRVVPPLILVPIAMIPFGTEIGVPLLAVAGYTLASLIFYASAANEDIPREYLDLARSLGLGRLAVIRFVRCPAILPVVLGGLRVVIALSVGIAVVGEYLTAASGLGRVMKYALSYGDLELLVVATVWSAIIAIVLDGFVMLTAARLLAGPRAVSRSSLR